MTDALVEAVRSVMTSYLLENVSPDTVRVALQAIEAAGYRVVPVEETETERCIKRLNRARESLMDGRLPRYGQLLVAEEVMEDAERLLSAMLSAAPRVGEGV